MRHSCPTDLVLFEADIMPLDLRRKLLLSKYFCKFYSYGDYNRTSAYLITWTNRHRLKRDSPFSRMQAMDLLDQDIEEHFLKNVFNPQEGLPRVHFKPEMGAHTSKNQDPPEYLQLWKTPPTHPWYNKQAPGGALSIKADRVVQTTISRLASGHIRGLSFHLGQKIYENCTKCNLVQATPDHLLFCAGLDREDIYSSPLLVYDFLETLGLMDLADQQVEIALGFALWIGRVSEKLSMTGLWSDESSGMDSMVKGKLKLLMRAKKSNVLAELYPYLVGEFGKAICRLVLSIKFLRCISLGELLEQFQ
ncbi:RNase H domain-containing protein [Trichonephila clavipes]|nr:RNase H domain-containing protein [Trichonephila clavipes]